MGCRPEFRPVRVSHRTIGPTDRDGAPLYADPELPRDQREVWTEFYDERIAEGMPCDAAVDQANNDLANWVADQIDGMQTTP